ncbi:MAG: hypothetical protein E6Q76_05295 [Rhizobium sp.]|nr:MAG: hypothetical protein E6Q76_05295 [Rhizobium sp.]
MNDALPAFVQYLNEHQCGVSDTLTGHPYTCRNRDQPGHGTAGGDKGLLIATAQGWRCPYCYYQQAFDGFEMSIVEAVRQTDNRPAVLNAFTGAFRDVAREKIPIYIREFSEYLQTLEDADPSSAVARRAREVVPLMVECLRLRGQSLS